MLYCAVHCVNHIIWQTTSPITIATIWDLQSPIMLAAETLSTDTEGVALALLPASEP